MKTRLSTSAFTLTFFTIWLLLSGASCIWGATNKLFELNENQILYLFSTSAQVLAGVYGLTLTGFIFFRNELSREEQQDETLTDATNYLLLRYFKMLFFITIVVLATFGLSNLAISSEATAHPTAITIIVNTGQSAFATSLLAIAYFVFDVIDPSGVEAVSKGLQDKIDPTLKGNDNKGDLSEFVRNYNSIEMLLRSQDDPTATVVSQDLPRPFRRTSNARLAEVLLRNNRISPALYKKLTNLITLRNSIIHGADPTVSNNMVLLSKEVLDELKSELLNNN